MKKNIKIVLLTNILSPYRRAFYKAMYENGKDLGIDFVVLLMNDTESDRNWDFDSYSLCNTILLSKRVFLGKKDSLYINTDLVEKLDILKPDILVLAGSYTFFPCWQALKWQKKHKEVKLFFWSESHLDEVRNYSKLKLFFRESIRLNFYSRMEGFWYPGINAKELISKYASQSATYINVPNLIENDLYYKVYEKNSGVAARAELRKKYGIDPNKKVFFIPARLTYVKGILPFLEIISKSRKKDLFQLVIAGDGELRSEIEGYATNNDLNLLLLGYRNTDEIAELYVAADVLLLPSLSDPNPLSCIEALWCGKAMLVSKHVGNYPEVICEGINGYTFSYDSENDALEKFESFLDKDEEWYSGACKKSIEIAEEKFELQKSTINILTEMKKNGW